MAQEHVVIIGAGFCGLAAAWELVQRGIAVTVLEQDDEVGGLAGSFRVGDASQDSLLPSSAAPLMPECKERASKRALPTAALLPSSANSLPLSSSRLEKFYHHWFTSDTHVMQLIAELGLQDRLVLRATRTGMYYAHNFFRLSSPLDLLRFRALPLLDRLRLGLLVPRMQLVRNWHKLEGQTAADWIRHTCGERVYRVVWEPLLRGKFGAEADNIAAVWLWNKLKLRGGSRSKDGREQLAYLRGGFAVLAEQLAAAIQARGGKIITNTPVRGLDVCDGQVQAVYTDNASIPATQVIATPALPIIADLLHEHVPSAYEQQLRRITYLANVCVVLELKHSLSDLYWINVNDPSFPFVGVIEHTNFEPATSYQARHIIYLSRYLPASDPFYSEGDDEIVHFSLQHVQRMFPKFTADSLLHAHVWRADYAQPVVVCHYNRLIPSPQTPLANFYIASMAQIYPQDRGTNYAVAQGRAVARTLPLSSA